MEQKRWCTKRKIVAGIAMLIFASVGRAQSSVTLYGLLDAGLLYTSKTENSATGQNSGKQFSLIDAGSVPSEFGLAGVEDLGGGLKAKFKIESGITMSDGGVGISNGNFFGRQAWVSLENNLGELKTGLQFSPFFLALYKLDPRGLSTFGSSSNIYSDSVVATGVFDSNAVSYTSPVIAGFQGSVLYAPGGEAGDFSAGRNYSAYLQTPIPSTIEFFGRMLGASYKFGKLTVNASFTSYKIAGSFTNNVYGGGGSYSITPTFNVNGGVWYTIDRNDSSNHSILGAVGVQEYLSKSTSVYTQIGIVNNHGAMDTGLSINGATQEVAGTTVGAVVGIRHLF